MKSFNCGSVNPGCEREFRGLDDEGIVARAGEHAAEAHGVSPDSDFESRVRASIS